MKYLLSPLCVQPEPRSYRETHLLDSGGRRRLPHAVPVRSEPGSGPEVPQLAHRERGRQVRRLQIVSWVVLCFIVSTLVF